MKKIILTIMGFAMVFSLVQCSTTGMSMNPKVMACNAGCDTAYDECVKKAGKSEAKKAACDVSKQKCYSDCEAKAK